MENGERERLERVNSDWLTFRANVTARLQNIDGQLLENKAAHDEIRRDLIAVRQFIEISRQLVDEWVGKDGEHGLRKQVVDALQERSIMKMSGRILVWLVVSVLALWGSIAAYLHGGKQ